MLLSVLLSLLSFLALSKAELRSVEFQDESEIVIDYSTCKNHEEFQRSEDYEYCYNSFPANKLSEELGVPSVQACCDFEHGEHGFIVMGTCEGTGSDGEDVEVGNTPLCLHPQRDNAKQEKFNLECPPDCLTKTQLEVTPQSFSVVDNNKTVLKLNDRQKFQNQGSKTFETFCVWYDCGEGWQLAVEYCDCNRTHPYQLACTAKTIYANEPLCCPPGEYLALPSEKNNAPMFLCQPFHSLPESRSCGVVNFEEHVTRPNCSWRQMQTFKASVITEDDQPDESPTTANLRLSSCVGAVKSSFGDIAAQRVECFAACGGATPCYRLCCGADSVWNGTTCSKSNVTASRANISKVLGIQEANFYKAWNSECSVDRPIGDLYMDTLCKEEIMFNHSTSSIYLVEMDHLELKFGEFCLSAADPGIGRGHWYLQGCLPKREFPDRSEIYSSILILSVICLFLTILVYLVLPGLRNHYSKLMINLALSMLIAFLALVSIKQKEWFTSNKRYTVSTCRFLGYFNQYFILATFTWMTVMSNEIFKQIRGLQLSWDKNSSIWRELLVGYGVPALFVLITFTVSMAMEGGQYHCSHFRPKIGYKDWNCLFYHKTEKFLWLYFPILVMLLINTFMFCYVIYHICRSQSRETNSSSCGKRKEYLDRMVLYSRLFLGMGFIWYFEIFIFVTDSFDKAWSWIPDVLNMLQGVWVFFIFVCKRNVISVILRQKDKLYDNLAKTTRGSSFLGKSGIKRLEEDSVVSRRSRSQHPGVTTMVDRLSSEADVLDIPDASVNMEPDVKTTKF